MKRVCVCECVRVCACGKKLGSGEGSFGLRRGGEIVGRRGEDWRVLYRVVYVFCMFWYCFLFGVVFFFVGIL